MSKTVEDIGTLKINLLSQAQYDAEKAGGRLADDELYLTPSSGTGVSDVEVNGSSVVSGGVAEITINDIPSGGTAGQVLTKESGTDYDVSWEDPSGGTITDVTVDGTSIVDNGVAELETATQLRNGLMTALDKQKLDGIASGAEVNVNADWNAVSGDAQILNKPTIPTVNDATLTIQKNGSTVNTFTANASSNVTANITVPTDTSDLTNGAGYITSSALPTKVSDLSNDSGFITTETDPTVPSWAKASSKPSYTFSEIGSKPTTISGYGITDAKISNGTITLGSNSINLIDMFYPVGSYYETSDSTFNPNVTWGGTWVLETEGQVHVSAGENYEVGDTGGAETQSYPLGMNGGAAVRKYSTNFYFGNETTFAMPKATSGSNQGYWVTSANGDSFSTADPPATPFGGVRLYGNTESGNNMQPYIVVNRWHRTA